MKVILMRRITASLVLVSTLVAPCKYIGARGQLTYAE